MKTRILIVDDEEKFSHALAERLKLRDYDVTTSQSGEDAVTQVEKYNYDVVILDVLMPGMNGIETLREIKKIKSNGMLLGFAEDVICSTTAVCLKKIKPLTEVIMLTGHATVETAIDGMKLGAMDFLMKPCETDDLVSKIEKAHHRKMEQEERIREAKARDIIASPRSVLKE